MRKLGGIQCSVAVAGLVGAALASADLAWAQVVTCAQTVVTARGEPSRYKWLASSKARGNWRARVRAMPRLGASFADWRRAANASERCLGGPAGQVCIVSGTPCRAGP